VPARRSGLGRGLGALIPGDVAEGDDVPTESSGAAYRELPISAISPNRRQPRDKFDAASLEVLAASIAEIGVLQPILVRNTGGDTYELVAGERRWRAAQVVGLATIPALVREVGDQGALEQAIVENLHRSDLNPLEEAAGYQHLIDEFGLTQDAVATRVGRSRSAVTNLLRLFQLAPTVQGLLADGELSAGHGRALLAIEDPAKQLQLARLAVREGMSVRELERRVKGDDADGAAGTDAARRSGPRSRGEERGDVDRPVALLELERLLEDHLQTKVEVVIGAGKGRISIDFADLDDLERIYLAMVDGSPASG
jgi:ParB family chromosome partitioning protein